MGIVEVWIHRLSLVVTMVMRAALNMNVPCVAACEITASNHKHNKLHALYFMHDVNLSHWLLKILKHYLVIIYKKTHLNWTIKIDDTWWYMMMHLQKLVVAQLYGFSYLYWLHGATQYFFNVRMNLAAQSKLGNLPPQKKFFLSCKSWRLKKGSHFEFAAPTNFYH